MPDFFAIEIDFYIDFMSLQEIPGYFLKSQDKDSGIYIRDRDLLS